MKSFIIHIKNFIRKVVDIMSEVVNVFVQLVQGTLKVNGVEVKSMAVIYASLITDGLYTFERVKKYWKSDVAVVLVSLGADDLITDPAYLQEAKDRIAEANQAE